MIPGDIKFTIITRTSGRPKFFAECRKSVLVQSEQAYHLVGYDNTDDRYPVGDDVVFLDAAIGRAHNLYFNTLRYYVPKTHPWIIFLDDDDKMMRADALKIIKERIRSENDLILWRVAFQGGRLVPPSIGQPPEAGNISGIGYCYHVKHWVPWPGMPYGDFMVIDSLYKKLSPVWLQEVLTGIQTEPGHGNRNDL